MTNSYPKRLIEVDLPIKRISEYARREKDSRRGHVPLLYIWPATRPPAACRAVMCAALWPDPADRFCLPSFRAVAADLIIKFARKILSDKSLAESCSPESFRRWNTLAKRGMLDLDMPSDQSILRDALFDFIADFSNPENATNDEYLSTSRAITQAAHIALGGEAGTTPLVLDPFSGGGAIPLEALRIGAEVFASDFNPVAVLYNKAVLEYIPRFGSLLISELQKWERWVDDQDERELSEFYPRDPDGSVPIAYLWARTIQCEGPSCGAEIPLMRGLWLAKKSSSVALKLVPNTKTKRVLIEIINNAKQRDIATGTVKRGSATCPVCGYTTPVSKVRMQLKQKNGGAKDARLFCVVTIKPGEQGRSYRLPTHRDLEAIGKAEEALMGRERSNKGDQTLVPDEQLPLMSGVFNAPIYGHNTWGSLFTPRQALALTTYLQLVHRYMDSARFTDPSFAEAVGCMLGLVVSRLADLNASLCGWQLSTPNTAHVFVRWAIPMFMDFGEINPLAAAGGSPESVIRRMIAGIKYLVDSNLQPGTAELTTATRLPLPDDSVQAFVTDPPYYNAVPYADLSDFFYVWLKRSVGDRYPHLFSTVLSPKEEEICEMAGWDPERYPNKDKAFFEREMKKAMAEGRRTLSPNGIGVVIFAHKSTAGWEAQLQAMIDAGWIITGSWPIDTEMLSRLRARNSAALASSVHLVCRPREYLDGSLREDEVGDWRDVLSELPKRIHEWMPRLAEEGVVGADAIFACLGPALEIFSRYSRVEKASGEVVTLREYLEQVWGAVAKEALNLIFTGADATGFEEDARLTAMWLWTLSTNADGGTGVADQDEEASEDEVAGSSSKMTGGYVLEYDAARKIAQGLGAHFETLTSMVEVKGDMARLLPVSERTRYLFGKDEGKSSTKRVKKAAQQLGLFEALDTAAEDEGGWGEKTTPKAGQTVLDRVHQSMILFAAGRSDALKRFLVEDGIGQDQRFWRLAQAFSALYPATSDEKRWVDGVLARKKGLGF